jgi:acyl-CoA reductase-like NAD-dependent aldehyde dehydrogenase
MWPRSEVHLGRPEDAKTTLGPVASVAAARKIHAQVTDALVAGATTHVPSEA